MSAREWAAVILGIVVTVAALAGTSIASVDPARTSVVTSTPSTTIYRPECRPFESGYWSYCDGLVR